MRYKCDPLNYFTANQCITAFRELIKIKINKLYINISVLTAIYAERFKLHFMI